MGTERSGLPDDGPELLEIEAAAAYMTSSERFMRRLVQERRVAFFKVGRAIRFSREDLDRFLADSRVEAQR